MKKFLMLLVLVAGCAGSEDTVTVESGPVKGMLDAHTRTFLAIPYAAPPVGPLRWKAPQPPPRFDGTLANIDWGKNCKQTSTPIVTNFDFDEDCLTLNIWTPRPAPHDAPVMVFIHGGAFIAGGAQDPIYDGGKLAQQGVVVVTINYRLGALGFVALPELTAEDPSGSSGQQGFLDQRAALQWVQRNIAGFGGDPGNVTLFGESAGGVSILMHLVSAGSRGLFHKAIVESGPSLSRPGIAMRWPALPGITVQNPTLDGLHLGSQLVHGLGCDGAADVLDCMRGKSAAEVEAAVPLPAFNLAGLAAQPVWWPVIDGVQLTDEPMALLRSGNFAQVPLLIGTNHDEGTLFEKLLTVVSTTEAYDGEVQAEFGAAKAAAVEAEYPVASFPGPGDAAAALFTDHLFTCDTRRVARTVVATGLPVWRYHFEHVPEVPLFPHSGVTHSAELPFVFGTDFRLADDEQALSQTFQGYWARFARTGDPNGDGAPAWPAYDGAADTFLKLDTTPGAGAGVKTALCDFWDTL